MSKELTSKSIQPVKDRMATLGMDPNQIEREASFALQIINRDTNLQSCTQASLLSAILNVANIGLTLNPAANECCIVARWNSKLRAKEAVLEPMYQGLARLAMREGVVKQLNCQVIYKNDHITVDAADNIKPVLHMVNSFEDRGDMIGVYCISTDQDGLRQVELMSVAQVNAIRDEADAYKAFKEGKLSSTPWSTSYTEMARKTVLKRLFKYLNRKGDESQLTNAIELSNSNYGLVEQWQLSKINYLLENSSLDDEDKANIEMQLDSIGKQEAFDIINRLEVNQLPDHPGYQDRVGKKQIGKQVAAQVENDRA